MKHYLFGLLALSLFACKKDDPSTQNTNVDKIDSTFVYEKSWGCVGSSASCLTKPTKIAVTDSFVFISDEGFKILKYTRDGKYLDQIQFLNSPNGVFSIYNDSIYVHAYEVDTMISIYDLNFKFGRSIKLTGVNKRNYYYDMVVNDSLAVSVIMANEPAFIRKTNLRTGQVYEGKDHFGLLQAISHSISFGNDKFYITDPTQKKIISFDYNLNVLNSTEANKRYYNTDALPYVVQYSNDYIFVSHSVVFGRIDLFNSHDYKYKGTFTVKADKPNASEVNIVGIAEKDGCVYLLNKMPGEAVFVYKKK